MFKRYSSLTAAKGAIKRAGLSQMAVEYPLQASNGPAVKRGYEPVVLTQSIEDANEVRSRGFNARVDQERAAA